MQTFCNYTVILMSITFFLRNTIIQVVSPFSVAACLPQYSVWQNVAEASRFLVIAIVVQQPMHQQLGNLQFMINYRDSVYCGSLFLVFPNARIQFMLYGFVHCVPIIECLTASCKLGTEWVEVQWFAWATENKLVAILTWNSIPTHNYTPFRNSD